MQALRDQPLQQLVPGRVELHRIPAAPEPIEQLQHGRIEIRGIR